MSFSGVLVIDKPSGLTSHDVVARVRRKLKTRKVGHAGTLDPDVTGVLVLCIGDATRLIEYLATDQKAYEGRTVFGVGTDTDDASGNVVAVRSAAHLSEGMVLEASKQFVGQVDQVVPAYSAVHIDGKRAYELARAGAEFQPPKRTVSIQSLDVWGFVPGDTAETSFRVACSKGTYIRSLCRDWGAALDVPAHMLWLRRIQSGSFGEQDAVPLEEWESLDHPEDRLLSFKYAIRGLPTITVASGDAVRLSQGQTIRSVAPDTGIVAVFHESGDFVAIAEARIYEGSYELKPKKVLWKKGN